MTEILSIACGLAFVSTILMHVTRKNSTLITLYVVQSLAFVVFLAVIGAMEGDRILTVVALLTFIIKVVVAPYFFYAII